MPRIPNIILNSVIYLYPDCHHAESGTEFGGSGFLLAMDAIQKGCTHLYAVTAAHVVRDGAPVVRVNLRHESSGIERTRCFEFEINDWVIHPDHDLAICPFPFDWEPSQFDVAVIKTDFLVTEKEYRDRDIGPGDDVVYIGRFRDHAGKFENMPSVRFGNVSMNPNDREPLEYTYNGVTKRQSCFLVEARSRSGYSGSPVFFMHQHAINNSRAVLPMFDLRLLGIDFAHLTERVDIATLNDVVVHWKAEVHAGMMGVVPAWLILDFLNSSTELIAQRDRDENIYASIPKSSVKLDTRAIEGFQGELAPGSTIDLIGESMTTQFSFPEGKPSSSAEDNRIFQNALKTVLSVPRNEAEKLLDQKQKESEK